jgi:dethiobiotin synthetase/adenosylmethionine--8-amino-7-oxononanoate aminotransferase
VAKNLDNWAYTSQRKPGLALLETAGGVHSPGPNGTSQADLYRPLRLPVILIADSRLGGISSSVSSFESLSLRGYDVESVMLFQDDRYKNDEYLSDFFGKNDIPVFSFPAPPDMPDFNDGDSLLEDRVAMSSYYESLAGNRDAGTMINFLSNRHSQTLQRLESMSSRASEVIWYPFTQHQGIGSKDITVIDSAHGDYFQTYQVAANGRLSEKKDFPSTQESRQDDSRVVQPTFDGSASWWTQGLGHANPALSLSAAYAAGRYGHVMFAGAIHEPALALAELLVESVGNPRLRKVFYSDNGSTGMEVAIKMGLRASCTRYGWDASEREIGIIGLQGSYHGDTIGVMDCSEPSTFNQRVEWYRGRGYWFKFPQVKLIQGTWTVDVPDSLRDQLGQNIQFSNLNDIFDLESRKRKGESDRYKLYIKSTLEELVLKQGKKFGAVMLEPVLLGAGGMIFV